MPADRYTDGFCYTHVDQGAVLDCGINHPLVAWRNCIAADHHFRQTVLPAHVGGRPSVCPATYPEYISLLSLQVH
jgi:hypothetical protein